MKKILLVTTLVVFVVQCYAQQIFLQRNGKVLKVYARTDLQSAVKDAQDGDKVYFTQGNFSMSNGNSAIRVDKKISFVGCGAESKTGKSNGADYTQCDYKFDFCFKNSTQLSDKLFDNIRLNGQISFNDDYNQDLGGLRFRKCYFAYDILYGKKTLKDVTFDRCKLSNNYNRLPSNLLQLTMRNCYITILRGCIADASNCNIINCNIGRIYGRSLNFSDNGDEFQGVLTNCIVGNFANPSKSYFSASCKLNYVLYLGTKENAVKAQYDENAIYPYSGSANLLELSGEKLAEYVGSDGKVVGYSGGKNPFTLKNSLPEVTYSSVHWDTKNKKIELDIKVNQ